MNRDAESVPSTTPKCKKHVHKGKATILITGDLGVMDMALLYSSLLPSACRWHIRVRAGHQHCPDCLNPPLERVLPWRCLLASLGHCWHCHNGTPAPAGVGVPILEQDSCPSQPPTKLWPKHSSTSLMGLLDLLDHSDQHQAGKSWESFCFILKTNACSNSVEWGQQSSLMFKTIIQWLQFFPIRKL